jgi:hypothetical protein
VHAAVLPDQRTRIDGDDLTARMRVADDLGSARVVRIAIRGHDHAASDDEVIRVRRREPASVIDDRARPRQRMQRVRTAVGSAQRGELLAHASELIVMRIGHVVAGLEHDRIVWRETRERVDVRVGVVAFEIAVVEPEHAVGTERFAKTARHLVALHLRMPLVQTAPRRENRALAVRFDRAAFERPVDALVRRRTEQAARDERFDHAIVALGAVLAAPARETEIEQTKRVAVARR